MRLLWLSRSETGNARLMRVVRRKIEVAVRNGTATVEAYTYGDWGTYQHGAIPGAWSLVLLPLGLCLPPDWSTFRTAEQARAAMVEIARLKNSWHLVRQEDLTKEIGEKMKAICQRRGSIPERESYSCAAEKADEPRIGMSRPRRLNGYAGLADA